MNAAEIYTKAREAGDNDELWLEIAKALDELEGKAFFSKELHEHNVLALASMTQERDTLKIELQASRLVAEIAEQGMVRWKRQAEEAERQRQELDDLIAGSMT